MPYGISLLHTSVPQLKMMVATVDTQDHGHLIATQMVEGNCADDLLYQPILARVRQLRYPPGLLSIGDTFRRAIATRAEIVAHSDCYLVPLANVGETDAWQKPCINTMSMAIKSLR